MLLKLARKRKQQKYCKKREKQKENKKNTQIVTLISIRSEISKKQNKYKVSTTTLTQV